jgi:transcriptional regulator with XRE-family HTH domain
MTDSSNWTAEQALSLCELRTQLGLDMYQLAKLSSLSPQQLAELETPEVIDGRSAFYSQSIKAHAGKKLLEKLSLYRT